MSLCISAATEQPHTRAITIANVDLVTGKQRGRTSLAHLGLEKANDKIMREIGLQVLGLTNSLMM